MGRRSSGSKPGRTWSMTNWPGRDAHAISGASSVRRKWSRLRASWRITGAGVSNGMPKGNSITIPRHARRATSGAVLPSNAVTFPKLVVHAALSGLYGGFVVVVLLRLANPVKSDEGHRSAAASFIVIAAYTLLAAVLWPVLYAA